MVEENKAEISFNPALLRIERRKIPLRAKKDNEFTATEDLVIVQLWLCRGKLSLAGRKIGQVYQVSQVVKSMLRGRRDWLNGRGSEGRY